MSNLYYCPNCNAIVSGEEGATAAKCGSCGYEFPIYNPSTSDSMEAPDYSNQYRPQSQNYFEQPGGGNNSNQQTVENFNLITAYISMFKKYFQFSGRSRRSEYWFSLLANGIVMTILYIIMGISMGPMISSIMMFGAPPAGGMVFTTIMGILISLYSLAVLIPGIAMCIRRLHDIGKSGWFYLFCLIPTVGAIILLVFYASDSQPGENQYGPNPKGV